MQTKTEYEVTRQNATQDYDCNGCPEIIPDETDYVRVATLEENGPERRRRKSAVLVEKFHIECWRWAGRERD